MKYSSTLIAVLILAFVSSSRAQVAPEKQAEIEKMLQLTGMYNLIDQMKAQMIANFKVQAPEQPADFWDTFSKKLDSHRLVEKLLPIYDKYYTLEDLRAVNSFYSSPAGQKILKTLPQVMHEAMQAGQQWGQEVGQEAQRAAAARAKTGVKPEGASSTPEAK